MKPILFDKEATTFDTNGIGRVGALSCMVTERINNIYSLDMIAPANDRFANEIVPGNILYAIPAEGEKAQPFRIYQATKILNGKINVLANHISYDLSGYPMREYLAHTCAGAVASLSSRAIISSGFTFSTDIVKSADWILEGAASVKSCMVGEKGLTSVYGGEWYYDHYSCMLKENRGNDNGVEIRYGKNMTGLDAIYDGTEDYTGVLAFWNGGSYVSSNIQYIDQYATPQKIMIVDHTSDFSTAPTSAQLNTLAQADLAKVLGITRSLTVSFVPLWQTEEYKHLKALEKVKLGDFVTVTHEKYNISAKLEVVQTNYDVLAEHYESIELGTITETLSDMIVNLYNRGN